MKLTSKLFYDLVINYNYYIVIILIIIVNAPQTK